MALGWGGAGEALSGSLLWPYLLRLQQQQQQQQSDMAYQNWTRQQQFLQQQNAPALVQQQAHLQLQSFLAAYPNWQQDPALVAHYQRLSSAAGLPVPTRQTTAGAPTVGVPGQAMAEGGLSRYLAPQGMQQIPSGQLRTEPILPQGPRLRQTLGEYDPRFARTAHANTPVPRTAQGEIDSAALERYYALIGAKPQAAGEPLTQAQRATILQQSYSQAAFDILGRRGSGLSFGPDGQIILAAGQPPLTADEIARIQKRTEEIFNWRLGISAIPPKGVKPPLSPPAPTPPPTTVLPTGAPVPQTQADVAALVRAGPQGVRPPTAQPAVGTPPARARPAPTPRAQTVLDIWTRIKTPVSKVRWDTLTAVERAWLTSQGVTSGR